MIIRGKAKELGTAVYKPFINKVLLNRNAMSKKDYILLAGVMSQYNKALQAIDYKVTGNALMRELTLTLAQALKNENAKFDTDKFLTACGVTK